MESPKLLEISGIGPGAVLRELGVRIVASRGLTPAEAEAMIAAQMPAEQKRRRAHYVIDNTAGLDDLEETAGQVWEQIRARAE